MPAPVIAATAIRPFVGHVAGVAGKHLFAAALGRGSQRVLAGKMIERVEATGFSFLGGWRAGEFSFFRAARISRGGRGWRHAKTIEKHWILKRRYSAAGGLAKQMVSTGQAQLLAPNSPLQVSFGTAAKAMAPNIRVDTSQFDNALRQYMQYTKKDLATVVNSKGYWIAYNAMKGTYKADKQTIRSALEMQSNMSPNLTVAQALVLSRNRQRGGKRLSKSKFNSAARKVVTSRTRASAFLRSGWVPALRILGPHADKGRRLTGADQHIQRGKDKGGGKIATPGWNPGSAIWNTIYAGGNAKAQAYMTTGLQAALNREAADMMQYVERKMQQNANRFNRR